MKKSKGTKNINIVTTAMTDTWPSDEGNIIFLGSWCLKYRDRSIWEKLDYKLLPHPWRSNIVLHKAAKYQESIYEQTLPIISNTMNIIHSIKQDLLFWRILIGPWLLQHIQILHERYVCIKAALEHYPNAYFTGMSKKSFSTPRYFWDYLRGAMDDPYNYQLYTIILDYLGVEYKPLEISWSFDKTNRFNNNRNKFYDYYIKSNLHKIYMKWAKKGSIAMIDMYITRKNIFRIMVATQFKARLIPLIKDDRWGKRKKRDHVKRSKIGDLTCVNIDEFADLLVHTLPFTIPKTYVEGFEDCEKWACFLHEKGKFNYIMTSNAMLGNDTFKMLAATGKIRNKKIIGIQHGGSYGSALLNPVEKLEKDISDEYWTWGWDQGKNTNIPMPSPKLNEMRRIRQTKNDDDLTQILYVTNVFPRYHYRTWSCPSGEKYIEYINWIIRFIKCLSDKNLSRLVLRLYPLDLGWGLKNRLKNMIPSLSIQAASENYIQSVVKSKIVVVDCNQTTLLECISANIPVIAFWDEKIWEIRKEAKEIFKKLYEVDIFNDGPERAAHLLNNKYDYIREWWNETKTQKNRIEFMRKLALVDANWIDQWAYRLKKYNDQVATK